jgi:hypothetical protein
MIQTLHEAPPTCLIHYRFVIPLRYSSNSVRNFCSRVPTSMQNEFLYFLYIKDDGIPLKRRRGKPQTRHLLKSRRFIVGEACNKIRPASIARWFGDCAGNTYQDRWVHESRSPPIPSECRGGLGGVLHLDRDTDASEPSIKPETIAGDCLR